MADIKSLLEWTAAEGEVKAVDRVLVKVMMQLVKHQIILTAGAVDQMDEGMELPEELFGAIQAAAESVVGKAYG